MRRTQLSLLLTCICLVTACTSAPQQTTPTIPALASAPAAVTSSPAAVSNSMALSKSLLLRIPKCSGLEVQEHPIVFSWPNIEELGDALWGYYGCDQPQAEVVAFYKAHMAEPPYNNQETNWVERAGGSVGVYYNSARCLVISLGDLPAG